MARHHPFNFSIGGASATCDQRAGKPHLSVLGLEENWHPHSGQLHGSQPAGLLAFSV
jgi:hypothetical protein